MERKPQSAWPYGLISGTARAVLVWEALWPLLVPAFIVACLFLAFTWFGGWHYLQSDAQSTTIWLVRLGFTGAFCASLWPLKGFRLPDSKAITRRIENASELENRPLTAVEDRTAFGRGDIFAKALWEEHAARMAKKSDNLTAGLPKPNANRFDPRAIRAMVPLIAFAAFFYSFSPHGGKIADAYQARALTSEIKTRMDAWISPPAYTKKPPIYLTLSDPEAEQKVIMAPVQSGFFLRYLGPDNVELFGEGIGPAERIVPKETDTGNVDREFALKLEEDQVLKLKIGEETLSQWGITLIPDNAPKIAFFEHPSSALSGSLQLSYTVQDDYGVVSARAIIEPLVKPDENARPLVKPPEVKLPLPRNRAKKGVAKLNKDLTEHPWAGSRVRISLEVKDDLGQTGITETREITLPGRRFSKPLALALIEQRRILAMDANRQSYVANLLDAVSSGAPDYIDDATVYLGMRVAYRRIVDARSDDDLRDALDLLWEIALSIEFGDLSEVERRLREAQENLSKALENGASQEEIDRLMDELRQAMNEMMEALAEQARNNPQAENPFDPGDVQTLTQNDLQRMMDRIEELAKSGNQDAARQMLSELQRMMDNLRAGRHEQQRRAEGNELNEALDKLSRLMKRQQELLNETFRMQRNQEQGLRSDREQGQQQQGQRQQQGNPNSDQQQGNQNGQMSEQELTDALRSLQQQQEELERQLGELSRQLEELGFSQPSELGDAQREMGEAGENLGRGDAGAATTDQGQALEALNKGAQNMMRQMAGDRQQGGQQQSQTGGQGRANRGNTNDPLGRRAGEDGLNANSDTDIPGEIDVQRARRILEAIRKRLAIPDNPIIEKDYLERLLRSE